MKGEDFGFANDLKAADKLELPRTLRLFVQICAAMVVLGLIWAALAIVDEVTRGNAKIIPSRQTQIVQSLEGGLIQDILVTEGQIVAKGEVLMRIDDTVLGSQFGEAKEKRAALQARQVRLEREARGEIGGALTFPDTLEQNYPAAVQAERQLHDARLRKLKQEQDVLDQQVQQKKREMDELSAQRKRLLAGKPLMEREMAITRRLHNDRVVPEIELLRQERQMAELNGQIDVNAASITRAEGAVREAESRRDAAMATFRASAEEDLTKTRADLAVLDEGFRAAQDRVRRTELRAPVRGVINRVHVTTIGAVVQPAATLIDIVPLDDSLLVEAQIRPQDIGFIRPQQPAVVKITAYDSAIFGKLEGKVERISADTTTDPRGEPFYRVIVRTDKSNLDRSGDSLPIIPGMIAQVEILTGRKSVLSYLLKPARLLRDEALKER
ncbi:MAG: HlyD family type I secretion periplasmic adaptor subunit [Proteobacteria bacterium]|nr:HlyD family type I secretion periplasmic adaptor subunit [Pseudomonadota bacterium]